LKVTALIGKCVLFFKLLGELLITLHTPVYWLCCTVLVAHVLHLLMEGNYSPSEFCVLSEICFSKKFSDLLIITI